MAIQVQKRMIPDAGVDIVHITLNETYTIDGVGTDTITLTGELEAHRGAPLLGASGKRTWQNALIVAQFTNLNVHGESDIFGPVLVSLNREIPSFGAVKAGDCKASLFVRVTMPKLGMMLNSVEPVQLVSKVETVPPIGDERTESVAAVNLVDVSTGRVQGRLDKAVVAWRDLLDQRVLGVRARSD